MIEIVNTNFRCNACKSRDNVKNISIWLDGNTSKLNIRLCEKCRKRLKKML